MLLSRQISTLCWLRKCNNSSFLPPTPSALKQAMRRSSHRSVILGRTDIFSYKKNDGRQDSVKANCPCGCLGWDTGFRRVRMHSCGLGWDGAMDPASTACVRRPSPRGSGLPAADSSLFARDWWIRGQRRWPRPRCWAPVDGLQRVAWAC